MLVLFQQTIRGLRVKKTALCTLCTSSVCQKHRRGMLSWLRKCQPIGLQMATRSRWLVLDSRSFFALLFPKLMRNQSLWVPGEGWSRGWNCKELIEGTAVRDHADINVHYLRVKWQEAGMRIDFCSLGLQIPVFRPYPLCVFQLSNLLQYSCYWVLEMAFCIVHRLPVAAVRASNLMQGRCCWVGRRQHFALFAHPQIVESTSVAYPFCRWNVNLLDRRVLPTVIVDMRKTTVWHPPKCILAVPLGGTGMGVNS